MLVRVSPRMLRHYEKCGLVCPAALDETSGYRLYSAEQIPQLTKITTLRDMGFSIDEIAEALPHFDNHFYMSRILRAKIAEAKQTLAAEQEKLSQLMYMSDTILKERNIMLYNVELKELDPVKVISLRGTIPRYNEEGILWERLGEFVGKNQIACMGGGYSIYHDKGYMEENPDVEIALPVAELGESQGDFVYKELPGIQLAATLKFSGPFDGGYDAASEKLAAWMEQNGYGFAGNLRGHVIVDPETCESPEDYLTELQAPVRKIG